MHISRNGSNTGHITQNGYKSVHITQAGTTLYSERHTDGLTLTDRMSAYRISIYITQTDYKKDRQTGRQAGRQTDRQIDRHLTQIG